MRMTITLAHPAAGIKMRVEPYSERAAETAVALVNTLDMVTGADHLESFDECAAVLRHHGWVIDGLRSADHEALRRLRPRLRLAFELDDERDAVEHLNRLLAECDVLPQMTDHDGSWHFHYARPGATLAQRVTAACVMALMLVIRDRGFARLGRCAAAGCRNVLLDVSKNRSRRFCNARTCGNRANVAAYRARQRAKSTA